MRRFALLGIVAIFIISFTVAAHASVDGTFEVAIVAIDGYVQVDEKGDGTWTYATTGMQLKTGAGIKTGYDSSIDIVYDAEGLNLVSIDENAQVAILESSLDLIDGAVLARFENLKKGSSFEVKTPLAACAIRGSGMGVDFIRDKIDEMKDVVVVMAFENDAYVRGIGVNLNVIRKTIIVKEGWKITIRRLQEPKKQEELTNRDRQMWDAWVGVVTGKGEKDKKEKVKKQEQQMQDEDDSIDSEGKDIDLVKKEATKKKEISPSS